MKRSIQFEKKKFFCSGPNLRERKRKIKHKTKWREEKGIYFVKKSVFFSFSIFFKVVLFKSLQEI